MVELEVNLHLLIFVVLDVICNGTVCIESVHIAFNFCKTEYNVVTDIYTTSF